YADAGPEAAQNYELGLLGMTPLVRIEQVVGSTNKGILEPGDVILRMGDLHAPRMRQFREAVLSKSSGAIEMLVLRDGEEVTVNAVVKPRGVFNRDGKVDVARGIAWDVPIM